MKGFIMQNVQLLFWNFNKVKFERFFFEFCNINGWMKLKLWNDMFTNETWPYRIVELSKQHLSRMQSCFNELSSYAMNRNRKIKKKITFGLDSKRFIIKSHSYSLVKLCDSFIEKTFLFRAKQENENKN